MGERSCLLDRIPAKRRKLHYGHALLILLVYQIMDVIDQLVLQLRGENQLGRKGAIDNLVQLADPRVVPPLIALLDHQDITIRAHATEGLIKLGKHSVPFLIETLKSDNHDVCLYSIRALGQIADPQATWGLIEILKTERHGLHYEVVEALANLRDERAIEPLIDMLGNSDNDVRQAAQNGLQALGPNAFTALGHALSSTIWHVRYNATKILGLSGDKRYCSKLIEALNDHDDAVCLSATEALGRLGCRSAVPNLIKMLRNNNTHIRREAVLALASLQDTRAIPPLVESLRYEGGERHAFIIESLVSFGEQGLVSLTPYVSHTSPGIRKGVVETLGRLNSRRATPLLVQCLNDPDLEIRKTAAASLSRLNDPDCVEALIDTLGDPSPPVYSIAARALMHIGETYIHRLLPFLKHEQRNVRARLCRVINQTASKLSENGRWDIPVDVTPYLLDALRHERTFLKDIVHVLLQIKDDVLARGIGLIYSGYPQVGTILQHLHDLKEWRHLSLVLEDFPHISRNVSQREKKRLRKVLNESCKAQRLNSTLLVCGKDFSRFSLYKNKNGFSYFRCRTCESTLFAVAARRLAVVLDQKTDYTTRLNDQTLWINGLAIKHPVDFDRIEIGECSEDDIISFSIVSENETDPIRINYHKQAQCIIRNPTSLSDSTRNLLKQRFQITEA